MKMTEIRALGDEDLRLQVQKMRRELFDLRFKDAVEQIPQPHRIGEIKHDIARILTTLRQRAAAAAGKGAK